MPVLISTSSLYVPYTVIGAIMAVGTSPEGFISGPDASLAFEEVKQSLSVQAMALGGNAVINCDFEVRDYTGGLNVIAFGTVVYYDDTPQ